MRKANRAFITAFIIFDVMLIAFVGVVLSKPDDFVLSRSAQFNAPASKVFAQINDLHKWDTWSPWAKLDPASVVTFEGGSAGVGSSMAWNSKNDQVGIGKMTITESVPNEKIAMKLEFDKPKQATNVTEFTFKTVDTKTEVTWTMRAKANFVSKAMGIIFNCEKMLGGMFEQGLANLRGVVEAK